MSSHCRASTTIVSLPDSMASLRCGRSGSSFRRVVARHSFRRASRHPRSVPNAPSRLLSNGSSGKSRRKTPMSFSAALAKHIAEVAPDARAIGVDFDATSARNLEMLLDILGDERIRDVTDMMREVRRRKDQATIDVVRRSADIASLSVQGESRGRGSGNSRMGSGACVPYSRDAAGGGMVERG